MIYLNETIYAIEKVGFKSRQDRSRACLKKQFLIFMGKHRDRYAARYRFSEELKRYFMICIYSTNQGQVHLYSPLTACGDYCVFKPHKIRVFRSLEGVKKGGLPPICHRNSEKLPKTFKED